MLVHMFLLLVLDAWSPTQARSAFSACPAVGIGRVACDVAPHLLRICALIRHATVASSIITHVFFELYFRAAVERWDRSDATARLGRRSTQTCSRRLPWCLLDLAALPVGIACACGNIGAR